MDIDGAEETLDILCKLPGHEEMPAGLPCSTPTGKSSHVTGARDYHKYPGGLKAKEQTSIEVHHGGRKYMM